MSLSISAGKILKDSQYTTHTRIIIMLPMINLSIKSQTFKFNKLRWNNKFIETNIKL